MMTDQDRTVLEFIGRQGKTPDQLAERFPSLDVQRLVQAGLVRLHRIEMLETRPPGTPPAPDPVFHVLTREGAEAIGVDPDTLGMA